jgi:hypothetical protein
MQPVFATEYTVTARAEYRGKTKKLCFVCRGGDWLPAEPPKEKERPCRGILAVAVTVYSAAKTDCSARETSQTALPQVQARN